MSAPLRENRVVGVLGGTGPLGLGLALRWTRAGETVMLGSRDGKRAQEAAEKLAARIRSENPEATPHICGAENAAVCAATTTLVLAVPFEGQAGLLKVLKPVIQLGSIVMDATVPLAASVGGRPTRILGVWQGSAAQQTAELLGPGVQVAAAFQNVSAEILASADPAHEQIDCDVIVCSDHPTASQVAMDLAERIPGVRAVDGGKLENARIVESITALLISINIRNKAHGAGIRVTNLPERTTR